MYIEDITRANMFNFPRHKYGDSETRYHGIFVTREFNNNACFEFVVLGCNDHLEPVARISDHASSVWFSFDGPTRLSSRSVRDGIYYDLFHVNSGSYFTVAKGSCVTDTGIVCHGWHPLIIDGELKNDRRKVKRIENKND